MGNFTSLSVISLGVARSSCLGDEGERPNERVIAVGIGWVLLASAPGPQCVHIRGVPL